MTTRGRFVTLEGGEAAGKSTQARLLADALRRAGRDVLLTREPGGTPGAEALRALLLDPARRWSPDAEILLHFAARAEHLSGAVLPALAAGSWVVCDRFADSTMAYQGYAAGADRALIVALAARLPVRPDLTLVLGVPADVRRARLAARLGAAGGAPDRYEAENENFHARVAEGFAAIAAADPDRCVTIDASGDVAAVRDAIAAAVSERLTIRLAP